MARQQRKLPALDGSRTRPIELAVQRPEAYNLTRKHIKCTIVETTLNIASIRDIRSLALTQCSKVGKAPLTVIKGG